MKENYILIEATDQQDLESILGNFANLYNDADTVHGMQLYRKKGAPEKFIVKFTNKPDFQIFGFLVNYLVYPMDFEEFNPRVIGFYNTDDVMGYPNVKKGSRLMLYINLEDDQPDNVYITNENNQSFIFDFGGSLKEISKTILIHNEEKVEIEDFNHIMDIYPSPSKEISETKPWWMFW